MVLVRLPTGARELDIVANINQRIICAVCRQLSLDPHIMSCGNVVCPDCLASMSSRTTQCPCGTICGHPFSFVRFGMQVLNLMVKCPNFSEGCNSLIPIRCVDEHLKQCKSCPLPVPAGYDADVYHVVDNLADTVSVAIDLGYPLKFDASPLAPQRFDQSADVSSTSVATACTRVRCADDPATASEVSTQRCFTEAVCDTSSASKSQSCSLLPIVEDANDVDETLSSPSGTFVEKSPQTPCHVESSSHRAKAPCRKMNENDILYMDEGVLKLLESGVPGRTRGLQKHFERSRNSFQPAASHRTSSRAATYRKLTTAETQLYKKYSLLHNLKQVKVVVEKLPDEDFHSYLAGASGGSVESDSSHTDDRNYSTQTKTQTTDTVDNRADSSIVQNDDSSVREESSGLRTGCSHLVTGEQRLSVEIPTSAEVDVSASKQLAANFKHSTPIGKMSFNKKKTDSQREAARTLNRTTSDNPTPEVVGLKQNLLQRKRSSFFGKNSGDKKIITKLRTDALKLPVASCAEELSRTLRPKAGFKRNRNQIEKKNSDLDSERRSGIEHLARKDQPGEQLLTTGDDNLDSGSKSKSAMSSLDSELAAGVANGADQSVSAPKCPSSDRNQSAAGRRMAIALRKLSKVSGELNPTSDGDQRLVKTIRFKIPRKAASRSLTDQLDDCDRARCDRITSETGSQNKPERSIQTEPSIDNTQKPNRDNEQPNEYQNEYAEEQDRRSRKRCFRASGLLEQLSKEETKRLRCDSVRKSKPQDVATHAEGLHELSASSIRAVDSRSQLGEIEEGSLLSANGDRMSHELLHEHELDLPISIPLEPLVAVKQSTPQQQDHRPSVRAVLELRTVDWHVEDETAERVSVKSEDQKVRDSKSSSLSSSSSSSSSSVSPSSSSPLLLLSATLTPSSSSSSSSSSSLLSLSSRSQRKKTRATSLATKCCRVEQVYSDESNESSTTSEDAQPIDGGTSPTTKHDSKRPAVFRQSVYSQKSAGLTLYGSNIFQRGHMTASWLGDNVLEASSFWSSRT